MATKSIGSYAGKYANLKTMPAMLSVAYVATSLYAFGGIDAFTINWLTDASGYTITSEHATLASMGVLLVAFMGSRTKSLEYYEDWEKVAIASAPVLLLGYEYQSDITTFVNDIGGADPLGAQLAFLVTLVGWGVAVR